MKRTKIRISLLLISLIFTMNIFNVFSYDKSTLPYNIKIGLFFDKSAKSQVGLESPTGFNVGIFNKDEFNSLFDLHENKILLKKDNLDSQNTWDRENFYHIQIGKDFIDYSQAYDFLNSFEIEAINSYLYYEDDWKVYGTIYANDFDINQVIEEINIDYGYQTNIVKPSNRRVQVVDERDNIIFIYDSSYELYFKGQENHENIPLVSIGANKYRGGITAKRLSNSDMTIINKLPLEEYLYGVVPSEMPASWPIEALKAQAVAARGFVLSNLNKYSQFDFNLCTTTSSQVYKGYSGEHINTNKAVDETVSQVMTYNGNIVEPYFHSNSGGHTEDSENIWSNPLPHIRGVKDDFSLGGPNSNWSESFTKEEIKKQLAKHNIFIGDIIDIKITSTTDNGRILTLVVYGREGQEVMEKQRSRTVFNLKSNYFSINANTSNNNFDNKEDKKQDNKEENKAKKQFNLKALNTSKLESVDLEKKYTITAKGVYEIGNLKNISIFNGKEYKNIDLIEDKIEDKIEVAEPIDPVIETADTFIFHGKGYGHGLGMSQYGAKNMADLGYKYDEILTHYYTGVRVE